MANSYLNEALKKRAAQAQQKSGEQEITLDDVSRVKVLSPGRQVFKRFIRNRLAVFGSVLLITMFVFSFLGPLVYPYGQKQIFYKFDEQNVNYGMAKENTAYNGYTVDESVQPDQVVANSINSTVKRMIAEDAESALLIGESGVYSVDKLAEDVYTLSALNAELVASAGKATVKIGTYDAIRKAIAFEGAEVPGLNEAAASLKGKSGTVELDGVTYTFTKGVGKSLDITAELEGVRYVGEELGQGFELALKRTMQRGDPSFRFGAREYVLGGKSSAPEVYCVSGRTVGSVYTRLTVDTFTLGTKVSDEFRVGALFSANGDGAFTADGQDFTAAYEDGILIVRDAEGKEFAEFTPFSVRRYTGEDSMDYDLKQAIVEHISEMEAVGSKSGTMTYKLPQQGASGEYVYDEAGELLYNDSELTITRRDTGEYVINANQIIYVIDMFSSPSAKHILGTDGDGFDVMARIMYGGRVSLMVGFVVVFLECFLGIIMGGLAGYYGGWVDMLIMRLVDIFYCLPSLPIMIILGAMMDALRMDTYIRLLIMMAALGIMGWAGVARLVRGQILSLREQEFMVATEATGIKVKDRIFHHLVPNVMPQLIVTATMGMGRVIITESTLSFLGLGVKHPLATWGTIINSVSSASAMAHYAHIWIPVGLLICLTVIAFNFVGDGLRDAYDPKAKR